MLSGEFCKTFWKIFLTEHLKATVSALRKEKSVLTEKINQNKIFCVKWTLKVSVDTFYYSANLIWVLWASNVTNLVIEVWSYQLPHIMFHRDYTAWKMSKYGAIFGPYFPSFGLNMGKYRPEKTPYLDTFHTVLCSYFHNIVEINPFLANVPISPFHTPCKHQKLSLYKPVHKNLFLRKTIFIWYFFGWLLSNNSFLL